MVDRGRSNEDPWEHLGNARRANQVARAALERMERSRAISSSESLPGVPASIWWDEDDGIPQREHYDRMPPDERPPAIQRMYEHADFEAKERFRIRKKAAFLQSKIPKPRPRRDGTPRRKPCVGVAIVADDAGDRFDLIGLSGLGEIPTELEAEIDIDGNDRTAEVFDEYLHVEQRFIEHVKRLNRARSEQGLSPLKIEAIAAAYPICWERCQPAMQNANIRAASPLGDVPPEVAERLKRHAEETRQYNKEYAKRRRPQPLIDPPGQQPTRDRNQHQSRDKGPGR